MTQWWISNYKPESFRPGQQANCRTCGGPIWFMQVTGELDYHSRKRQRGVWLHDVAAWGDGTRETRKEDSMDHLARPKEFCEWNVGDGLDYDVCGRPIKYEDVQAENYACGIHMKKELERKANAEMAAKREIENREREEIAKYEIEQYTIAADWLREHGYDNLIGDYKPKRSYSNYVERIHRIDVHDLYLALRGDDGED